VGKGVNVAQAGDTVIVHAGTYSETVASQRSGSSGSPITIEAYSGDVVSVTAFSPISHNYIVIQGFVFTASGTSATGAPVYVTGSNNQILSNTFYGSCNPCTGGEGACYGIGFYTGSNNTLSHNTFDGQSCGSTVGFGVPIYVDSTTSGIQVTYNLVKNLYGVGRVFEIYGNNQYVAFNEVYGSCDPSWEGGSCPNSHVDLFQGFIGPSNNVLVERNYFHDLQSQWICIVDWPGGGGAIGNINNWIFRNNIYANIYEEGFLASQYFTFENNTFFNVGAGQTTYWNANNMIQLEDDPTGDGVAAYEVFINNIIISNGASYNNSFVIGGDSAVSTHNNNYYGVPGTYATVVDNWDTYITGESGVVNGGNPQFVAPYTNCMTNTCNLQLQSSSPLIGKGANLYTSFTRDYAGNTRPSSGAWDIGAFQYEALSPSPPQNLRIVQ
jgi:hypothetical protein